MANEVEIVNGVTKTEMDGSLKYKYDFPAAVIVAELTTGKYTVRLNADMSNDLVSTFIKVTDKLGATNVVQYVDALANLGAYAGGDAATLTGRITAQFIDTATQTINILGNYRIFVYGSLSQSSTLDFEGAQVGASITILVENANIGAITATITASGYTIRFYDGSDGDFDGSTSYTMSGVVNGNGEIWFVKSAKII